MYVCMYVSVILACIYVCAYVYMRANFKACMHELT